MNVLDRERTVAPPGYSRWLVPPAAIAVHMCIGQVYGFSVFNGPLTKLIGGGEASLAGDWTIPQVGWAYQIALIMLGLSAAVFGKWVEKSGPRKTMVASAVCFCGGLMLAALAVKLHWLWLLLFGYGFIGGIGMGLGYIAPVSTLVKWFPDRPGMATGMAIMGFGGGALIGSPLATELMNHFRPVSSQGVAPTFFTMSLIYLVFMAFAAWLVKVPAADWKPDGFVPAVKAKALVTTAHVSVDQAWKTPQFWLLWLVLCLNISAGIGILGQASLMFQDMFGVSVAVGAGYVGVLSLFNMGGRFIWSSTSDLTGRKAVYCIYFLLGAVLYLSLPHIQAAGQKMLFVVVTAVIISMYGGGFATIPAYLRDLFGTAQVGAIHGRLITAWSAAAVIGPTLINYISTAKKQAGMPAAEAYNSTLYLMVGLLLFGCVCNLLVRPVDSKHHMK